MAQGTSNVQTTRKTVYSASATAIDTTGDKLTVVPASPIDVYRWGFITDVALDAGSVEVVLDLEDAGGANSTEKDSFVWETDQAAGLGFYREYSNSAAFVAATAASVGADASDVYAGGAPLRVDPGEQVVIAVDVAATAGDGVFFIEYVEHPFEVTTALTKVTS